MNITKSKRVGVAAALVLAGALVAGGAVGSANAAYPVVKPTVSVKITTAPSSAKAKKAITYKLKTVTGAKIVISYVKVSSEAAAKKAKKFTTGSTTTAKSRNAISAKSFKISKKGTYYAKITVSKSGSTTSVTYKKIVIK